MSDLGSELKNAVLSTNAKTVKAVFYGDHPGMLEIAKRWFGTLEPCDPGAEDIFIFEETGPLTCFLRSSVYQSIERGSHIFQFDPIAENFVRRDKVWFDKR